MSPTFEACNEDNINKFERFFKSLYKLTILKKTLLYHCSGINLFEVTADEWSYGACECER